MTTLIGTDNSNLQSLLFPSVNAFMDDLFLMSLSARDSRPFGSCIALSLARMSVNPFKSRNFVFEKTKILNENVLSVVIKKKQVFYSTNLRKVCLVSREDYIRLLVTNRQPFLVFKHGLVLINKSKHRPVQKLWILQHPLLPQLR